VTHWPQAWLGLAMNFGFVTAWVATTGDLNINLIGAAMAGCWLYVYFSSVSYVCPSAFPSSAGLCCTVRYSFKRSCFHTHSFFSLRYHIRLPGYQRRRENGRSFDCYPFRHLDSASSHALRSWVRLNACSRWIPQQTRTVILHPISWGYGFASYLAVLDR
jgi:hypothetical protein